MKIYSLRVIALLLIFCVVGDTAIVSPVSFLLMPCTIGKISSWILFQNQALELPFAFVTPELMPTRPGARIKRWIAGAAGAIRVPYPQIEDEWVTNQGPGIGKQWGIGWWQPFQMSRMQDPRRRRGGLQGHRPRAFSTAPPRKQENLQELASEARRLGRNGQAQKGLDLLIQGNQIRPDYQGNLDIYLSAAELYLTLNDPVSAREVIAPLLRDHSEDLSMTVMLHRIAHALTEESLSKQSPVRALSVSQVMLEMDQEHDGGLVYRHERGYLLKALQFIRELTPNRVLVVGTAIMYLAPAIQKLGINVTLLDPVDRKVPLFPEMKTIKDPLSQASVPSYAESFDVIIMPDVEDMELGSTEQALRTMHHLIRDDGVLMLPEGPLRIEGQLTTAKEAYVSLFPKSLQPMPYKLWSERSERRSWRDYLLPRSYSRAYRVSKQSARNASAGLTESLFAGIPFLYWFGKGWTPHGIHLASILSFIPTHRVAIGQTLLVLSVVQVALLWSALLHMNPPFEPNMSKDFDGTPRIYGWPQATSIGRVFFYEPLWRWTLLMPYALYGLVAITVINYYYDFIPLRSDWLYIRGIVAGLVAAIPGMFIAEGSKMPIYKSHHFWAKENIFVRVMIPIGVTFSLLMLGLLVFHLNGWQDPFPWLKLAAGGGTIKAAALLKAGLFRVPTLARADRTSG